MHNKSTHLVRRSHNLDVSGLRQPLDQVHRYRAVEADQPIDREHEPLLLVRLEAHERQPEVHPAQSERDQRVGASLALRRVRVFLRAEERDSAVVEVVGKDEQGKGREGEEEEEVEVDEEVEEVVVPGGGAIEGGGTGEEVVRDDVDEGQGHVAVSNRVDDNHRDLTSSESPPSALLLSLAESSTHRHQRTHPRTQPEPRPPFLQPLTPPLPRDHILSIHCQLLDHERERDEQAEWPADDGAHGEEEGRKEGGALARGGADGGLEEEGVGEESGVHGEGGGEECCETPNNSVLATTSLCYHVWVQVNEIRRHSPVLAPHIPALPIIANNMYLPTRSFTCLTTAR